MKLFGLRLGRLKAWSAALAAAGGASIGQWRLMLTLLFKQAVRQWWHGSRSAARRAEIRRCYAICVRCPLHDPKLRTCGLCSCYLPFKIPAGGGCAAREIDPNSSIGFTQNRTE